MKKILVRRFYQELWGQQNYSEIGTILHPDVTFRGSLGQQKKGHQGFIEYADAVHKALADYRCIIEDLIAEENKLFAKMVFTGIHQDDFLGFKATQQTVSWMGSALFTFEEQRIVDVWVLGDLKGLESQLKAQAKSLL